MTRLAYYASGQQNAQLVRCPLQTYGPGGGWSGRRAAAPVPVCVFLRAGVGLSRDEDPTARRRSRDVHASPRLRTKRRQKPSG